MLKIRFYPVQVHHDDAGDFLDLSSGDSEHARDESKRHSNLTYYLLHG